jgi:hypothetical protein
MAAVIAFKAGETRTLISSVSFSVLIGGMMCTNRAVSQKNKCAPSVHFFVARCGPMVHKWSHMAHDTFDTPVKVRLPREWRDSLQAAADREHLSVSDIVRRAIRFFLTEKEKETQPVPEDAK